MWILGSFWWCEISFEASKLWRFCFNRFDLTAVCDLAEPVKIDAAAAAAIQNPFKNAFSSSWISRFVYISPSLSLFTLPTKTQTCTLLSSFFRFFPHTLFYKSDSDYALLTQIQQSKQTTHFWASLFLFDFYFLLLFCLLAIHFGEVRKKQQKTDFFFGNFSCDSSLCWTWCSRKPQKYFVLQLQFGVEEFRVKFCD